MYSAKGETVKPMPKRFLFYVRHMTISVTGFRKDESYEKKKKSTEDYMRPQKTSDEKHKKIIRLWTEEKFSSSQSV